MNDIITIDTGTSVGIFERYELVPEEDKNLYQKTKEFDFNGEFDPKEISGRLTETLRTHRAYGLAAPQCGLPHRVFVMGAENEYITVFNPKILSTSEETLHMEEGCLSFPFLVLTLTRPKEINVEYQNEKGEKQTRTFSGISARIFLHEYDHLEGITFNKVAKPLALKMGQKKREKQIKNFARRLVQQKRIEQVKNENSN